MDQPVKQLVLFHSLHASIYYAVWFGLFDTLEVLSQKLQVFQSINLVAAEFDYPLSHFTSQISSSISSYAETLKSQSSEQLPQEKLAYTAAPMSFT